MNTLKEKASALVESRLLKTARVLAVRTWDPAGFVEIDLHLPGCDLLAWKETQHIKCQVAPFTYRDYTPAGWDADTRTCTLYIDTAHEGPGSHWAVRLKPGDPLRYMGIGSSHQRAEKAHHWVFLGDETAIGHFWSLYQLAKYPVPVDRADSIGGAIAISGAIAIRHEAHRRLFSRYFPDLSLEPVSKRRKDDSDGLLEWAGGLHASGGGGPEDTVFYLAGHSRSVAGLRKLLREKGFGREQIRAQGFWD